VLLINCIISSLFRVDHPTIVDSLIAHSVCLFVWSDRRGTDPATGCSDCACYEAGIVGTSSGVTCDKLSGQCPCKTNVEGRSCNRCRSNAFNLSPDDIDGCQLCDCDVTGTAATPGVAPQNLACDQNTGKCSCLSHRDGRRCDQCAPGLSVCLSVCHMHALSTTKFII